MGPPGSSPRTLGEHVGWVAGSRPLDSGAPHMVPPAAEQLGTRVSRGWCLASFPDPERRGAVQTGMGWVLDVQGRSARAVSVRGRLSPLAQDRRSVLPRRAAQALVVQTVRPTVLRGVVRQRRRARNTPCHAGDRSALATRGTCCAGPSVLVRTVRSALVVRGRPSAQGSLNAPDWLVGQHADRAWPTRRRGIRMPWWCWPVGRSPCCSPRQWPPGNESPCLILRQR